MRLGVTGTASREAERLMCLVAADLAFERASRRLDELLGWTRCANTIRTTCYRHAGAMQRFRERDPAASREFREAPGDVEFETDGVFANTLEEGWKEVRVGVFAKRHRGPAATPEQWDERTLPAPHARLVFAAIETSHRFGRRWRPWARRLGILDPSRLTVLGDGACWIWEEQRKHLRGAEGVLDVYHALEHVSETARTLHADDVQAAVHWTDAARSALLGRGYDGLADLLTDSRRRVRSPVKRAALDRLRNYLAPHAHRVEYARRLAAGRTIGSGLIEGTCKQVVTRRLKQTGARWRKRHLGHMTTLCCTNHSHHWNTYWIANAHNP